MGWRPVRVTSVAVEHERTGFQSLFEFFAAECDGLVVVVRTDDFEVEAIAHFSLMITLVPIPDPKPLRGSTTTMQSTSLEGGRSRQIGPGDVVIIPGKTPHWFSKQDADLRYLIFRPDPEGKSTLNNLGCFESGRDRAPYRKGDDNRGGMAATPETSKVNRRAALI